MRLRISLSGITAPSLNAGEVHRKVYEPDSKLDPRVVM